jgi:hypothetical protein
VEPAIRQNQPLDSSADTLFCLPPEELASRLGITSEVASEISKGLTDILVNLISERVPAWVIMNLPVTDLAICDILQGEFLKAGGKYSRGSVPSSDPIYDRVKMAVNPYGLNNLLPHVTKGVTLVTEYIFNAGYQGNNLPIHFNKFIIIFGESGLTLIKKERVHRTDVLKDSILAKLESIGILSLPELERLNQPTLSPAALLLQEQNIKSARGTIADLTNWQQTIFEGCLLSLIQANTNNGHTLKTAINNLKFLLQNSTLSVDDEPSSSSEPINLFDNIIEYLHSSYQGPGESVRYLGQIPILAFELTVNYLWYRLLTEHEELPVLLLEKFCDTKTLLAALNLQIVNSSSNEKNISPPLFADETSSDSAEFKRYTGLQEISLSLEEIRSIPAIQIY